MYIVIGQGAAGRTAAITLRQLDRLTPITMVSSENDYFYSRIDLPDIIAGKYGPEQALLQTAEEFSSQGINCLMGETVEAVLPAEKAIRLASGVLLHYDKLLLATGSTPLIPPIPGIEAKGVHSLWTLAQAKGIIRAATAARSAVVAGAGLIGLKSALALAARGLKVTVIERLSKVMPRQLDDTCAEMLAERIRSKGVEIMVNTSVEEIVVSNGAVAGVQLADRVLPAEMLIMSVGVKPETGLAGAAGIAIGRGITVDEFQQTSDQDIYAAGDCAEALDRLTGSQVVQAIWPAAVEQGRIAAHNMTGCKEACVRGVAMNSVEIAGLPLVSVGDVEGLPGDDIRIDRRGTRYRKVVMRCNRVAGVLCLGDIRQAGVIGGLVQQQREVDIADKLISPHFSFADLITG